MKTKLVLWGEDQKDEKILIAIELIANENKVNIFTFPESIVTELFYNRLKNEWRLGVELDFIEGYTLYERELSAAEDLLPEGIKVKRTDLISRAKTEWHFIVLSAKLYQIYQSELEDFKMRIERLEKFDNAIWEEMKGFWNKVQSQVREKNLFREHADQLRDLTNKLFDDLKNMRRSLDDEFKRSSKEVLNSFFSKINEVEEKVSEGLGLQPLFEKLKDIQKEFNDAKLTRKDRSKVWTKLDKAFKTIKEKKFGSRSEGGSNYDRIKRRYDGLQSAIQRMEKSIARDKADKKFQDERIESTDGQLEQQIRQAKLKMIEERISSKTIKLEDMLKTRKELEARLDSEKKKEEARKEKEKIKAKESEVKQKIANEIADAAEARKDEDEKLQKAAEKIQSGKKDNLAEAVSATLSEAANDMVDTVKAVAEVVKDKLEDFVEEIKDEIKDEEE